MLILPSIDIKDGLCVRLIKGDFDTVHKVADDPVAVADAYARAGAVMLHMVNLDGSLGREAVSHRAVSRIAASVRGRLAVELGGGIRSMADIEAALAAGIRRVVIGTAAVTCPGLMREASRHGGRVAVGIDALDGRVRTAGWREDTGLDYIEFAKKAEQDGVACVIFTDIGVDGTLKGPSLKKLEALKNAVGLNIVASGGVSSIDDVRALRDIGMDAVIIGKALYSGAVDLEEAIREGGAQCLPSA